MKFPKKCALQLFMGRLVAKIRKRTVHHLMDYMQLINDMHASQAGFYIKPAILMHDIASVLAPPSHQHNKQHVCSGNQQLL